MSDIVFILGAGASQDCGGPLMSDFLEIAGDLWKSEVIKEQSREFERNFLWCLDKFLRITAAALKFLFYFVIFADAMTRL